MILTNIAFRIGLQEHIIKTGHGSVSVAVFGDQDKPALITYPDLALNCKEIKLIFHKLYCRFSTKLLLFFEYFY